MLLCANLNSLGVCLFSSQDTLPTCFQQDSNTIKIFLSIWMFIVQMHVKQFLSVNGLLRVIALRLNKSCFLQSRPEVPRFHNLWTYDIIRPLSHLGMTLSYQRWGLSAYWHTLNHRSLQMHLACTDSPALEDYKCWQQWLVINLDVDRSDLVRNKALKDCHNPFRNDPHMKTENKLHHGDISRQIGKMGRQEDNMHPRLEARRL